MRKICLFFLLLMMFGNVFSQTLYRSITRQPSSIECILKYYPPNGGWTSYDGASYHIGNVTFPNVDDPEEDDIYLYRSYFVFNVSSIPDNATITQVEVVYSTGDNGDYTFRLTNIPSVEGIRSEDWGPIGSSTILEDELDYGSDSFYSTNFKNAVTVALESNNLIIGALSEDEWTHGSLTTLSLSLNIDYSYPADAVDIIVKNDLYGATGGNVGVAIYPNSLVSHSSPYSFTAYEEDRLNLAAYDNQSVSGKTWFFNDTEYGVENSVWRKYSNGSYSTIANTANLTTNQLTTSDDDANFIAYLKSSTYTTSGTLSYDEIWFTSFTLEDDVFVPDGKTLTIASGTSITLDDCFIKCQGTGRIVNNGTVSSGISVKDGSTIKGYYYTVGDAMTNALTGQSVYLSSGSYSGWISMRSGIDVIGSGSTSTYVGQVAFNSQTNCELKNLNTSNLDISGGNSTTKVTNVRTNYRIELNNSSAFLSNVTFLQGDYYPGIDVNDGNPVLYNITSTTTRSSSGDPAVYLHGGASPNIYVGSIRNKNRGIQIGSSCYATTDADFCSNTWDMYALSGAWDSDIDGYFSAQDPEDCLYYPSGDLEDYYEIGSWNYCGAGVAKHETGDKIESMVGGSITDKGLKGAFKEYNNIRKIMINDAKTGNMDPKLYETEFEALLTTFADYAQTGDEKNSPLALKLYQNICFDLEKPEQFLSLLNKVKTDNKSEALAPHLAHLTISYYSYLNDVKSALIETEMFGKNFPKSDLLVEVLYNKGVLYRFGLEDCDNAAKAYSEVIERFPDHPTAESARASLERLGVSKPETEEESIEPIKLALGNFPNPFNPTTEIHFSLPETGFVSIKVFDVMGRLVTTLVRANMNAGAHQVIWNSRDQYGNTVASGMYFYRMQYQDQTLTQKMVLMR